MGATAVPEPSPKAGGAGTAALMRGRYLSLTSYRRNGTAVATPVWFVRDGERILVNTDAESGKAKRIRRNPAVTIARCTATGRLRGEPVPARALQLPAGAVRQTMPLMRRKYRLELLLLNLGRAARRLAGRGQPGGTPVIIEITLG